MFEPMNACALKDSKKFEEVFSSPNYFIQEKMRGMRAILTFKQNTLHILSRGGKEISLPHLSIPSNTREFVLDCELYNEEWDDAILCGVVHRTYTCPEKERVKAAIFDILYYEGRDLRSLPLIKRLSYLEEIRDLIYSYNEHLFLLPLYEGDKHFKETFLQKVFKRGGEGVLLKNIEAPYISGKRPANNWYKVKYTETYDCVIIGFVEGEGRYQGLIGSLVYGQVDPKTNKLIPLGSVSGFTDELRKEITLYFNKYVGKVIEIKAMGRTPSGALEHPVFVRFRDDKKAEECYID